MDVLALLLALAIRTFVFQTYNMPSGSMAPTLEAGDVFVASKLAYNDPRAWGLPPGTAHSPAFEPRRGDVVVFRLPRKPKTVYVKRIVGMPGDRVQMVKGRLAINGDVAPREPIAPRAVTGGDGKPFAAPQYVETLPDGVRHPILELDGDDGRLDDTPPFDVPAGRYFLLGDNRDNSLDSRVPEDKQGFGLVPRDHIVARVKWVILSTASGDAGGRQGRRFMAAVR